MQPYPYLYAQDPGISPSTASDLTLTGEAYSTTSTSPPSRKNSKRVKVEGHQLGGNGSPGMNVSAGSAAGGEGASNTPDNETAVKPKRVRTGCLTCRERHLKCDEGLPVCQNCRKSNRQCKRGLRLNFIDTQVKSPPVMAPIHDWNVNFLDESREIASEYKGGLSRYGVPEGGLSAQPLDSGIGFDFSSSLPPAPVPHHQSLPSIQGMLPDTYQDESTLFDPTGRESHHSHAHSHSESTFSGTAMPPTSASTFSNPDQTQGPIQASRDYMDNPEEVLFMQVFVEEVGLWMDSMDAVKHFSELLPFHSLSEVMLYNAFLACGARHLALVNAKYSEEKALHYYNTATTYLLNALQNPNRDTVICATTATILNVYEVMCERALQRMNHIAGARALIKECGWNARSTGVGAACFWLNVGMELLSCLHFNWQVAWDPDEWGVDMVFDRETEPGREEVWTHRILYIVAKICNFRASIPRHSEPTPQAEQARLQNRYDQWKRLKQLADAWNDSIPRTMHPMAYLHPYQTISQSNFPEVWLIKRPTIVARLFYHMALVLLSQVNPIAPIETSEEMRELQQRNSIIICGIVAHVKDRGVASVALRSLAVAAECLSNRREQEEVVRIFDKIKQETGWRIDSVVQELRRKWGWPDTPEQQQPQQVTQAPQIQTVQQPLPPVVVAAPPQPQVTPYHPPPLTQPLLQPPSQALIQPMRSSMASTNPSRPQNPLLAAADFSMPQHPYQNWYVAPSTIAPHPHFSF